MSRSRAPMDIRIPISRIRSVTETSMMFMIPIPPTSSEIEAMLPRSSVKMLVASAAPSAISDMSWTWKSSVARRGDAVAVAEELRDLLLGHGRVGRAEAETSIELRNSAF